MKNIKAISKSEAEAIREHFGDKAHIAIVNRQSNHKKRYVEEMPETLAFLDKLREEDFRGRS